MRTDSIKVGTRFRKDLGSIEALVDSIKAVGLLHPIVVDLAGNLIAGERRLVACQRLGWKDIPATVVDLGDHARLRAEHDENTIRQAFTPSEAVAIAKAIKDMVKTPVGQHADQRDGETFAISGRTVDKAAKFVGMSGRTLEKATAVVEAAAADPTLEPVVEEMDKTGKVDPAYRKVAPTKPQAHSASGPTDDPTGLPERGRRMSRAPEDMFARVLHDLAFTVDLFVDTVDTNGITATPPPDTAARPYPPRARQGSPDRRTERAQSQGIRHRAG